MSLVSYLDRVNSIDNLFFDSFFRNRNAYNNLWDIYDYTNANSYIKIDMKEVDNEFIITADVPGVDKSNIDININDNYLTIKTEKNKEKEESKSNFYYSERSFGVQSRTIKIPKNVDKDNIKAKYENGVLNIRVPKTNKTVSSKTLTIE
jgi:HSP20 family protein